MCLAMSGRCQSTIMYRITKTSSGSNGLPVINPFFSIVPHEITPWLNFSFLKQEVPIDLMLPGLAGWTYRMKTAAWKLRFTTRLRRCKIEQNMMVSIMSPWFNAVFLKHNQKKSHFHIFSYIFTTFTVSPKSLKVLMIPGSEWRRTFMAVETIEVRETYFSIQNKWKLSSTPNIYTGLCIMCIYMVYMIYIDIHDMTTWRYTWAGIVTCHHGAGAKT